MTEAIAHSALHQWLDEVATLIRDSKDIELEHHALIDFDIDTVLLLVDVLQSLEESLVDTSPEYYTACIFGFDLSVAKLQAMVEHGHRAGEKGIEKLMAKLTAVMLTKQHSISYWLPMLNAFYDVHVELSPALKDAYLTLAGDEEDTMGDYSEEEHVNSIKDLLHDMKDMSDFEKAEHFFAQSHAMPEDFFIDLLIDLYSVEEGKNIAILMLLHPKAMVREFVSATFSELMPNIILSSLSLARLKLIKPWYPKEMQPMFDDWIKIQRKKGVVFSDESPVTLLSAHSTEVDGSGAQGLFLLIKQGRKKRFCGMLLHMDYGIKDVWLTPLMTTKEIGQYFLEAFDEVTLRVVDEDYINLVLPHFLAITLSRGTMPTMAFLEIQELLGLHWAPQRFDVKALIDDLAVKIQPFSADVMRAALSRTLQWTHSKKFTESWYFEEADIDKIVNRYCEISDGVKICDATSAHKALIELSFEKHRERFVFHFLWVTLWLKAHSKKNENAWKDSLMVAYAIQSGTPLTDIPLIHVMAEQSVANSVETMNERKTYLN